MGARFFFDKAAFHALQHCRSFQREMFARDQPVIADRAGIHPRGFQGGPGFGDIAFLSVDFCDHHMRRHVVRIVAGRHLEGRQRDIAMEREARFADAVETLDGFLSSSLCSRTGAGGYGQSYSHYYFLKYVRILSTIIMNLSLRFELVLFPPIQKDI